MIAADPIVMDPGSPEWVRCMTASKVAAVLGLSPWQSRFSLWYEMAGAVEHQAGTPQQARGHYLEDGVARWVADQHGLTHIAPGGCWRNRARPWQVASPDRLVLPYDRAVVHVSAAMEVKTSGQLRTSTCGAVTRSLSTWARRSAPGTTTGR
jgi:predicted phage-related endonuclease